MVVRGVGLLKSIEDIEGIVISAVGGVPTFVRDVGRVKIGLALQTGLFGLNCKLGGVEGIVLMRRGENPSDVLDGVAQAIQNLNDVRLPRGIRISPIYDRRDLVANTLHTVFFHTLLEGLLIVVAVLFLFLGSVRAALFSCTLQSRAFSFVFRFICYGVCWNTGQPA